MATIVLARHGETAWNRTGRRQGWAPTALTDRGRKQARRLGERLRERFSFDRVVASDLRRARQTVEELAAVDALDETAVEYAADWRERDKGVLQGLSHEEMADFAEFSMHFGGRDAADATPERGESYVTMRARAVDAFETLRESARRDGHETVLVVAHEGPIRQVVGHHRGFDVYEAYRRIDLRNCSFSELELGDEGVTVVSTDRVPE